MMKKYVEPLEHLRETWRGQDVKEVFLHEMVSPLGTEGERS